MANMELSPTVFLGVDPGVGGGLAWLRRPRPGTPPVLRTAPMPVTDQDVLALLRVVASAVGPVMALIEEQRPMPTRWVDRITGRVVSTVLPSTCTLCMSYAALRMALAALSIPQESVAPQRWQGAMHLPARRKGEQQASWKQKLRAKAQQLHPGHRITLATADAVLIATYLARREENRL